MNNQDGKILEMGIQLNFEWKNSSINDISIPQIDFIPYIERQENWEQPDSQVFKDDLKNLENKKCDEIKILLNQLYIQHYPDYQRFLKEMS